MSETSGSNSTIGSLDCETLIRARVKFGCTYQAISMELQNLFPGRSGLSARSVRRFCNDRHISYASKVSREDLEDVVENAVYRAGPSYGRRTLTGLLRSEGVIVGEQRVRSAMLAVTPTYVEKRKNTTYHQINPTPYYAEYFGHKIHLDQNEKLGRFGVTHVAASDGYSGKLLGVVSMPTKNNVAIYRDLFRPVITEYGLWDQVRVDCGREFALILYVQNMLSAHRTNMSRLPYVQTQSKENHLAERHWVEINSRVNYPIKQALTWMQENEVIDMDCPTTKFCVSLISGILCKSGINMHVAAWNNHRIPGPTRGVPNVLAAENNHAAQISMVPSVEEACELFQNDGGHLSPMKPFGNDPLAHYPHLVSQRQKLMEENCSHPDDLFACTVNGNYAPLAQCLQFFIDTTMSLAV